jgi:hypothetical protein
MAANRNLKKLYYKAVVPKVCSAENKGPANSSQGICGYIILMAALKFSYLLDKINNVLLKIITELL